MGDMTKLTGIWVEINERCTSVQTVLMRADADVPPSRGGRRQLEINPGGGLATMAQGATDRMETAARGQWSLHDETLEFNMDGWEGDYVVESITDTELILHRR